MKTKLRILACITLALYALTGASVWEGAASVSSGGDFSQAGYFAATNSFPRNTIVDVTNLESGKTVRVIVASGLETPGLLAVLSKEAAASIGLSDSVIGRIKMSQPEDPIAFSRFTDGLAAEGFPAYGFGDGAELGKPEAAPAYAPAFETAPVPVADGLPAPFTTYAPESEWEEATYPAIVERQESPEYSSPATPAERGYIADSLGEPALAESPVPAASSSPPPPVASALTPADSIAYDYTLVPAEERPPEYSSPYTIDPDSIIPGISGTAAPSDPLWADDYPLPEIAAVYAEEPAASPPPVFSIPIINSLERGRYYVQVGAYSTVETVEAEVLRLGGAYPLAVFNAGGGSSVYRVLLGPLNQGESGAVLKRFKSIGYKDAFVRNGN